jgi:hypothetical protein
MDRITLQNYRCFGSEEQSARLAPLTLLVGPNSTGKTSFLALIRALWDVAFREVVPNFREHPYDLGSWDEIAFDPGGRDARAESFSSGFDREGENTIDPITFRTSFVKVNGSPFPNFRTVGDSQMSLSLTMTENRAYDVGFRVGGVEFDGGPAFQTNNDMSILSLDFVFDRMPMRWWYETEWEVSASQFAPLVRRFLFPARAAIRPYSSAPTRTNPHRTYDPALTERDAEGDYVPSYLAHLSRRGADEWLTLKAGLEKFGAASELFDEIQVRSFGRSDGDPFQIQVRKHSGPKSRRRKGPWRNLIDVGYGVSQALPVLTELLRPDGPTMFLLQQPEVHLHPKAQAALGTLFCQVAAGGRQLVIETHSDYIIDRVRMDVRDGTTGLKPEDVSILYFEPGDVAVRIHSIRIDDAGNIKGAPEGYRQFFTDEMMRSIWA